MSAPSPRFTGRRWKPTAHTTGRVFVDGTTASFAMNRERADWGDIAKRIDQGVRNAVAVGFRRYGALR